MRALKLRQVAEFAGGTTSSSGCVQHVTIDSRTAKAGSLFVALEGENVDGHEFVPDVLKLGGYALVREGTYSGPGIIEVECPLEGLQNLAKAYLEQFSIPVVAVTGSNGKTSTKDMIAQILRSKFSVHNTSGNYNNEIGLPLTILGLDDHHDVLVVEMGMRGLGQISHLASICPPTVGVITNIGPVHLELLGSMGNIAKAKGELLEALGQEGVAVLNGDDPSVRGQARRFPGTAVYYGLDPTNDVVASGIDVDVDGRPTFHVEGPDIEGDVKLAVAGVHNVWNACAAISVGLEFDIPFDSCAEALEDLALSAMRLEVQRNPEGAVIVNDAYNASPASVRAALDTITHMKCEGERIAILGDMLELGTMSPQAHAEVGAYARECCDKVVFIGTYSEVMQEGAGEGEVFATVDEFIESGFSVGSGDLVLVKASRGLKFERVVEQLMKGRN